MKRFIIISFLLFTGVASGQSIFYSFFTRTYPTIFTSKIENIERRITFEPNTITIATQTELGKEIETLIIQATDYTDDKIVILCRNRSNQKITIVIPDHQETIRLIDYFYHSSKTNEETQLRFYVEQIR